MMMLNPLSKIVFFHPSKSNSSKKWNLKRLSPRNEIKLDKIYQRSVDLSAKLKQKTVEQLEVFNIRALQRSEIYERETSTEKVNAQQYKERKCAYQRPAQSHVKTSVKKKESVKRQSAPTAVLLSSKDIDKLVTKATMFLREMKYDAPNEKELGARVKSIVEELQEFAVDERKSVRYPETFSDLDRSLMRFLGSELNVGFYEHDKKITYLKRNSLDRNSISAKSDLGCDDVYVDVSKLASCNDGNFISHLRLRRLNSMSGIRGKLLMEVAENVATGSADPVEAGDGGVYAVAASDGHKLAMFKPLEEEKFVREGIAHGEGAIREEAAYVLDARMSRFSDVPPTAVASLSLSNMDEMKQGAVQRFMESTKGSMEDFGMPRKLEEAVKFVPVNEIHKVALLDVRLFNTDRHPGNILLIGDSAPYKLTPIDHGCILPSWYCLSEARFDWIEYPQSEVPFSKEELLYIRNLDPVQDAVALRSLGIREECITTLKICTIVLKVSAAAGKSLRWIGEFMQRSGCFENPSNLEVIIKDAAVASGIPMSFIENEYREKKSDLQEGILSRRPPNEFFEHLTSELKLHCNLSS